MMSRERRLGILGTILLMSLGYLIFGPNSHFRTQVVGVQPVVQRVLPGKNEIFSIALVHLSPYNSVIEVDYFYNGNSGPYAPLRIEIPSPGDSAGPVHGIHGDSTANPGRNKVKITVLPGNRNATSARLRTQTVNVTLSQPNGGVLVNRSFDQEIDWPSTDPYSLASNKPEEIGRLYTLCVETIDSGNQFEAAKRGLEQILLANPGYVPAYAELARYQMKTNWSANGLLQAEQSLNTALRLDPNHANTLVLIGYVYAHQRRFKEAEEVLRKAEKLGTGNIWLYTNWGELRALEGKRREAVEKYRKALLAPVDLKTYERARVNAYEHLLDILTTDKQWTEADALYQQRINKYPDNGCYKASYAEFHLFRNGDYDNAIVVGTRALEQLCQDDRINERLILAMAYYTKWAKLSGSAINTPEADQYFSRGQALYSDMTGLMYSLARSSRTAVVIPALNRRNIKIDLPDREGISALGHSIIYRDIEAGRNLLRYGANVNQALNADHLTPLMFAASRGDREFVAMLLKHGADRQMRTRSGYTAERLAAENGFKDIAASLAVRSGV